MTAQDTYWPSEADVKAGEAWALERLAERGVGPSGESERVKLRPWSVVLRVPTVDGPVWFKANGGLTRYEAALAGALSEWAPGRVLTPLAVDTTRGWQLLPDGGTPLRELDANKDLATWERFVAEYSELQRLVTPRADELLALGVPDQRPTSMPAHFDSLLDDPAVEMGEEARSSLRALRSEYADACARLAEAGPPPTLDHNDLHSGNVLPTMVGDVFFDWGDASVAHPFTSMLVGMRTLAWTFEIPRDDPAVLRFRDAYLEPWGLGADGPELVRLAAWTGTIGRALTWRRALIEADPAAVRELDNPVGGWAEELLDR